MAKMTKNALNGKNDKKMPLKDQKITPKPEK
jgi:hypothetical protein